MNSLGIHPLWLAIVAFGVSSAHSEVGEFSVSEALIREMQIIKSETTPFRKDGRLVTPSIQVNITSTLKDSEDDVTLNLNFDLKGTSKSRSFNPVVGNKGVTAEVTANVQGRFQQEIKFDGEKIKPGRFAGHTEIQPGRISVDNNFGVIRNLVNRRARMQAPGQIQAELPKEKKDLQEKMQEEIEAGLQQATEQLDTLQKQIHQVFTETEKLPFDSKFSSKSGAGGGISLRLYDTEEAASRGPKPELFLRDQIATTGIFHQDLLTKTLSKELAGKEMKIAELQAYLCSPTIASLIDFCQKGQPVGALGLSVIFDEKDPIQFKFENGRVSIQINAKNRVGLGAKDPDSVGVLSKATKPKGGEVDLEPYQVNISYALKDGIAELEDVSVRGITLVSWKNESSKPNSNHGNHGTWGGFWNRLSGDAGNLLAGATRTAIEREFRKILKERIEFPSVSFPTKLKTKREKEKIKAEIVEASSLVPMEVKSENGWLAISMALCKENVKPLGLSFDSQNRISSLQPGSPADLAGFKVGDRITSFGSANGRSTALMTDINPFLDFIKEQAISKSTTQRIVNFEGKSSSGVPFKRKVSLCPSQLKAREEAEALLSLGNAK
ncbi:MAG: PDZ domain-containing protein [Pseudomonadota bacterium]